MAIMPGAEPFAADGGTVGVLLIHGFTGTPHGVRDWARHLAEAGLSVRAPRLPGHGTRWQEMNQTRWEDWYGEAERNLDALLDRCPQVFVMGLSMGGTLALRLAELRGDDVAGLVLVNPSVLTLRKDAALLPALRLFIPSFPGVSNDIKADGVRELAYDRIPLRAAHSLSQLWRLVRTDLPRVTQPLLLFSSTEDHVVESANATTVLENVSSTDRRHILLADSYHVATLDNDAPQIFADSLTFVRTHAPSLSGG